MAAAAPVRFNMEDSKDILGHAAKPVPQTRADKVKGFARAFTTKLVYISQDYHYGHY